MWQWIDAVGSTQDESKNSWLTAKRIMGKIITWERFIDRIPRSRREKKRGIARDQYGLMKFKSLSCVLYCGNPFQLCVYYLEKRPATEAIAIRS